MKKILVSLSFAALLLASCANEVETLDDPMPDIVTVEIQTASELPVGEEVTLQAYVAQGDEAVNDAQEVLFEVWESGFRSDGVMLQGVLDGDGTYRVKHTFTKDGVYYMYAHTTARDMHVMPKQQLIVGTPNMDAVVEDTSTDEMPHH